MGYLWRALLIGVVIWLLYRLVYNWLKKPDKTTAESQESLQEMVQDPVCKVYLPRQQAIEYKKDGQIHYFCSEQCKDKYKHNNV